MYNILFEELGASLGHGGYLKLGDKSDEMTVDAVVRQLKVTPRTLRYYEEIGLITPASRSSGGHRLYNQKNIERVTQILSLKEDLGFSLDEIREILDAEKSLETLRETFKQNRHNYNSQKDAVDKYIVVLRSLIGKMDAKIKNLSSMRNTYQERLDRSLKFIEDNGASQE